MHAYIKAQDEWVREHRISRGSLVRVVRTAEDYARGWGDRWAEAMTEMVGGIYRVRDVACGNYGIELWPYGNYGIELWPYLVFPFFVLAIPTQEELVLFALSDE